MKTQHNDTQHKGRVFVILRVSIADYHLYWASHMTPLCWVSHISPCLNVVMLSDILLSVVDLTLPLKNNKIGQIALIYFRNNMKIKWKIIIIIRIFIWVIVFWRKELGIGREAVIVIILFNFSKRILKVFLISITDCGFRSWSNSFS